MGIGCCGEGVIGQGKNGPALDRLVAVQVVRMHRHFGRGMTGGYGQQLDPATVRELIAFKVGLDVLHCSPAQELILKRRRLEQAQSTLKPFFKRTLVALSGSSNEKTSTPLSPGLTVKPYAYFTLTWVPSMASRIPARAPGRSGTSMTTTLVTLTAKPLR